MFSFLKLDLREVPESLLVLVITLAAVGAGAVWGQPALSWLALGLFTGFAIRWLLGLQERWGWPLVLLLSLMAGVAGFYFIVMTIRSLEAMS